MSEVPPDDRREDPLESIADTMDDEALDIDEGLDITTDFDVIESDAAADASTPPGTVVPPPRVVYAEIPNPFDEGSLVAHDRQALATAIAAGDPRRGIQAADEVVWSPESRVRDIEEEMIARLRARRIRRGARRMFWRIVAVALPLLVTALLGDIGLLIRLVPVVGPSLGELIGSAGASVGGLPLGMSIAILPSIWLWRRKTSDGDDYWPKLPRNLPDELEFVPVGGDVTGLLADIESTIMESREYARGRTTVSGADAHRLEDVLHRAHRLARRAGVEVAAAVYLDLSRSLHVAGRPAERRFGIRSRRRAPAVLAELLAPYRPTNARASTGILLGTFRVFAGLLTAVAIFLLAGIFRIGPTDFEVIRPNRIWAYSGSLDHFAATEFSWVAVEVADVASAIPVEGPGWFWSWPVPLTRREHIPSNDHRVSAEALLGQRDQSGFDTVRIDFLYWIDDTRAWVRQGSGGEAEAAVADTLAQSLADFIEEQRRNIQVQQGGDITEILKDNMTVILQRYLGRIADDPEFRELGIRVDTVTDFGFAVFSP